MIGKSVQASTGDKSILLVGKSVSTDNIANNNNTDNVTNGIQTYPI